MSGTGGSVSLPPIAGQFSMTNGGVTLPSSGAWTALPADASSTTTITEAGLYMVTANTRGVVTVPAGMSVWVVGGVTRNGTPIVGTEHMAHQNTNTSASANGSNETGGVSFLVFLNVGDVMGMAAFIGGNTTAAGVTAQVYSDPNGRTRAAWIRARF